MLQKLLVPIPGIDFREVCAVALAVLARKFLVKIYLGLVLGLQIATCGEIDYSLVY
jgi:uncharacterized protein YggT (Ycf19 family)